MLKSTQKEEGEKMYNKDVRNYAKSKKVFLYQIAELLNVSESTFIKSLRKEQNKETKKIII